MKKTRFAATTTVPKSKSLDEIERLLERYGAEGFMRGWERGGKAMIQFHASERMVRFVIPMPRAEDIRARPYGRKSAAVRQREIAEQETRQRWRALALVVKAKLEAVESGITTFESEFLAHIVMPDGRTVAEHALPSIEAAYSTGTMQPLLPSGE